MSAEPGSGDACMAILAYKPSADGGERFAKRVATAQARAAIAGFELQQLADGSFIAAKAAWGLHTMLPGIDAAEAWLVKVGA